MALFRESLERRIRPAARPDAMQAMRKAVRRRGRARATSVRHVERRAFVVITLPVRLFTLELGHHGSGVHDSLPQRYGPWQPSRRITWRLRAGLMPGMRM